MIFVYSSKSSTAKRSDTVAKATADYSSDSAARASESDVVAESLRLQPISTRVW